MPVPAGRPGRHSRHEKRQHGGQVFSPPVLGPVCRCDLMLVVQDVGVGPVLEQQGDKRVAPAIRRLVQRGGPPPLAPPCPQRRQVRSPIAPASSSRRAHATRADVAALTQEKESLGELSEADIITGHVH